MWLWGMLVWLFLTSLLVSNTLTRFTWVGFWCVHGICGIMMVGSRGGLEEICMLFVAMFLWEGMSCLYVWCWVFVWVFSCGLCGVSQWRCGDRDLSLLDRCPVCVVCVVWCLLCFSVCSCVRHSSMSVMCVFASFTASLVPLRTKSMSPFSRSTVVIWAPVFSSISFFCLPPRPSMCGTILLLMCSVDVFSCMVGFFCLGGVIDSSIDSMCVLALSLFSCVCEVIFILDWCLCEVGLEMDIVVFVCD